MTPLERFAERVVKAAAGAEPERPVYVRVRLGEGNARKVRASNIEPGPDPVALAERLLDAIAIANEEEPAPRALVEALRRTESAAFDAVTVATVEPTAPKLSAPPEETTALSVAIQTIERMAKSADARADAAERRALEAGQAVLRYAEAAMAAEHAAELTAMVAANQNDRVDRALEHVAPVMKMAIAKAMGLTPTKQLEQKDPKQLEQKDAPPPSLPDQAPDPVAARRAKALSAAAFLRQAAAESPELLNDAAIVSEMRPLVLAAMGAGHAG